MDTGTSWDGIGSDDGRWGSRYLPMGVARSRKGKRRRGADWRDGHRRAGRRGARSGSPTPSGSPCSPAPASRPTRASPTSAGPNGRVDEEPGGREDGDDPALPRRPRGPPDGVAEPRCATRRARPSPTPATPRSSSWSGRASCTPSSPRTSTACTRRPAPTVELVVEVHGTIWWTRCWDCQDRRPMAEALDRVRAGEEDPPCVVCGGILKSDTISFGQSLVPEVIDRAMRVSEECDLLLAVGSTLQRLPGGQLRAPGQGRRRPGRHRQRRPDRHGPPRRRRPPRPDRRDPAGARPPD